MYFSKWQPLNSSSRTATNKFRNSVFQLEWEKFLDLEAPISTFVDVMKILSAIF
jgi:hypothetical protein